MVTETATKEPTAPAEGGTPLPEGMPIPETQVQVEPTEGQEQAEAGGQEAGGEVSPEVTTLAKKLALELLKDKDVLAAQVAQLPLDERKELAPIKEALHSERTSAIQGERHYHEERQKQAVALQQEQQERDGITAYAAQRLYGAVKAQVERAINEGATPDERSLGSSVVQAVADMEPWLQKQTAFLQQSVRQAAISEAEAQPWFEHVDQGSWRKAVLSPDGLTKAVDLMVEARLKAERPALIEEGKKQGRADAKVEYELKTQEEIAAGRAPTAPSPGRAASRQTDAELLANPNTPVATLIEIRARQRAR